MIVDRFAAVAVSIALRLFRARITPQRGPGGRLAYRRLTTYAVTRPPGACAMVVSVPSAVITAGRWRARGVRSCRWMTEAVAGAVVSVTKNA